MFTPTGPPRLILPVKFAHKLHFYSRLWDLLREHLCTFCERRDFQIPKYSRCVWLLRIPLRNISPGVFPAIWHQAEATRPSATPGPGGRREMPPFFLSFDKPSEGSTCGDPPTTALSLPKAGFCTLWLQNKGWGQRYCVGHGHPANTWFIARRSPMISASAELFLQDSSQV